MFDSFSEIHPWLPSMARIGCLVIAVLLAQFLGKSLLVQTAHTLAKKSKSHWDDVFVEFKVFSRLAELAPALIIYLGVDFLPNLGGDWVNLIQNVVTSYMILIVVLAGVAFLNAINAIYERRKADAKRPIKGFVQLLQIIMAIVGVILIIANLIDQSPGLLLSGLGAMTAVTMLVFKDTITSLVASIQLTAQDMVRVGDWIEMPKFGADGDVIDVELHLVRIQNFDKTITTIPTHKLISDSFKNWRGMSESGGRRIKRSLYYDLNSVRFLTDRDIERLKQFSKLEGYLTGKKDELSNHNTAKAQMDQRRLTNIGTMRAYIYHFLKDHPRIRQDMTLLVRQLSPCSEGLPIELYCFTDTTEWAEYEAIQGDIFDHLLAISAEFDLQIFQQPSGSDWQKLNQ